MHPEPPDTADGGGVQPAGPRVLRVPAKVLVGGLVAVILLVAVVVIVVVVASSGPGTPTEVVEDYLEALAAELTLEPIVITDVQIDGDQATVTAAPSGESAEDDSRQLTMDLAREDGAWTICD